MAVSKTVVDFPLLTRFRPQSVKKRFASAMSGAVKVIVSSPVIATVSPLSLSLRASPASGARFVKRLAMF